MIYYQSERVTLYHGDCSEVLATLPANSVAACITDPPYPCIKRDYGFWSEDAWHQLMRRAVGQLKAIVQDDGSAMFVLQPNSEQCGRLRPWLWQFLLDMHHYWGLVQDVYWWNTDALPLGCCSQGLLRPSLKYCVWLGAPSCRRYQEAVLWEESQYNVMKRKEQQARMCDRLITEVPSIGKKNEVTLRGAAEVRGGTTPFNVLPISGNGGGHSRQSYGHGARTPYKLCEWWVQYLTLPGDTVIDPFCGTATVGEAAVKMGRKYIGIELHEPEAARARLQAAELIVKGENN